MFKRGKVEDILNQAKQIDSKYEIFGVSQHQYKLNPPIKKEFIRKIEEKYHFILPKDYVQFITEIGDGGAGPYYGIYPFGNFLRKGKTSRTEKSYEAYRYSLAKAFTPQPLLLSSNEAEYLEKYFEFDKEAYEKNPEIYFFYNNDNDLCGTDGFHVLGTCGGQWNFGLITSGERYGQIFDTDREGFYRFIAYSFNEFYQNWLDRISDTKRFQKELKFCRRES